ncbi:MAG: toll/interleukin-1 receptor domain-containing protein [Desulfobulbaceae bacterium]|nr:toll/interleukin-1 receptor domain-containing protein [Desulfobulbaceae bacterium]
MSNKIHDFLTELGNCEETHEIERWQLRVEIYLKETLGHDIAEKFQSLNNNSNSWDGSAKQRGYLEALIEKKSPLGNSNKPMKGIDRINLIDRIGRKLQSTMTYSDIQGYLSGVGVNINIPTTDNGGSKWVYVKDLLAKVPDQTIFKIADELEIEHGYTYKSTDEILDSKFWHPNHFRLFLSHISTFKVKTAQLQKKLKTYGISSFVAHEDIKPTQEWQDEIEIALHSMDALCAILTPKFNESAWTDQEVGVAVGREVLIIPIRKGMDPYGFIGKYQGMQGEGKTIGEVAEGIFKILSNHPKTKDVLAGALADQITLAKNEDDAIAKLTLLRTAEALPQKHLEKIRENCKENEMIIASAKFVTLLNEMLKEREMERLIIIETPYSSISDDIPF